MTRPRWTAGLAVVLLALLASSCSSTTDGQPSTAAASSPASKFSLPAEHWDDQIFLCTAVSDAPCAGETTSAELSTVRSQLAADPTVTHVLFVSELDAIKLARVVLPKSESATLEVGDLPAEFLASTSGGAALSAQYAHDAGVGAAIGCAVPNRCAVSTLRAAGVVH